MLKSARNSFDLLFDQHGGNGFLQALDKKTGAVKWERKRTGLGHNNSTPLLIRVKGTPQLVVAGSNFLQGLDPANGEPVWWAKSAGFGESPAWGSGRLLADKGLNEMAVCVDPGGRGDVSATHARWQDPKSPGDDSSSVIADDLM